MPVVSRHADFTDIWASKLPTVKLIAGEDESLHTSAQTFKFRAILAVIIIIIIIIKIIRAQ